MPLCAAGHDSATTDFCDVCGTPLDEVSSPVAARQPATLAEPCPACGSPRTGRFCEACGFDFAGPRPVSVAPVAPDPALSGDRSAGGSTDPAAVGVRPGTTSTIITGGAAGTPTVDEGDAPDLPHAGPETAGAGSWIAVVTADRDYHRMVMAANGPDAASVSMPDYCPERRFVLAGAEVRIGRRSVSRGLHPEIDLSGPPEDPGVSHLHAVLLAGPDGTWSVLDPGSTNGTTINGGADPIRPNVAVRLAPGDRVHVGAWTTITLTRP